MSVDVSPNPDELLCRAQRGGIHEQGQLLELYRNYLTLLGRLQIGRRLQGKIDAADLVQETFLKAFRDFDRFRGTTQAELLGWLRQILACTVAMCVRRYGTKRRNIRLEQELSAELDQSSHVLEHSLLAPSSSPSDKVVKREQATLLADALEGLTEDYREVIILRHLEGLTFPEVAHRMNRTLDSVKKIWIRAVTQLRGSLGENS